MTEASATVSAAAYSRTNPFPATILVNRRLSGPESEKDTRHFELDLTGWGLSFEVGDSVGVYPTNDPDLVEEIIRALGATGDENVARSLAARLQHHPANTKVFEGHRPARRRCAYAELSSGSGSQTGSPDISLGHGSG